MTKELQIPYTTGRNVYFLLFNSVGQVYDLVDTAFETYLTAQLDNYDIAALEEGDNSQFYTADMPGVASGRYGLIARERIGASPAETDPIIGTGEIDWTGSVVKGIADLQDISATQVNAECDTALSDYDAPTKAEMDSAFTQIKGAGWSSSTDTLEAIRDRGDAAWTTAVGFSTHTAADVWTSGTRTLTALGFSLSAGDIGTDAIDADAIAADVGTELANALLDLTNGVEASMTPRQAFRLILAAAAGKLCGAATTTITIRDTQDSKDRITATVDSDGNRTAVTLNAS